MHRTRTPLHTCPWAAFWMTAHKPGLSALQLQHMLGLARYETAWLILHKLRRAMVNANREPLKGTVEIDETFIGGEQLGLRGGRQIAGRKALMVAVAVEVRGKNPGRVPGRGDPRRDRADALALHRPQHRAGLERAVRRPPRLPRQRRCGGTGLHAPAPHPGKLPPGRHGGCRAARAIAWSRTSRHGCWARTGAWGPTTSRSTSTSSCSAGTDVAAPMARLPDAARPRYPSRADDIRGDSRRAVRAWNCPIERPEDGSHHGLGYGRSSASRLRIRRITRSLCEASLSATSRARATRAVSENRGFPLEPSSALFRRR